MNLKEDALRLHAKAKGKFAIRSKVPVSNKWELSLAYSPGVAEPCKVIAQNPEESFRYTNRGNMVAVVSDGTAVLGLGNIGPEAALPVMEGKAILFKSFADIDAIPLCLATTDVDEVVETVVRLTPTFGGINLEDISGPRCFEIERKLKERLEIPVFHDDQHGTAVVCAAGLFNGLKLAGIALEDAKIVINGAGAAGYSIAMLLWHAGARRIRVCDTKGILAPGHCAGNSYQEELARLTNPQGEQ
ncbi:MAG: NAD(P)-dependent malic enzyme, partial [Bacillota bacterium]